MSGGNTIHYWHLVASKLNELNELLLFGLSNLYQPCHCQRNATILPQPKSNYDILPLNSRVPLPQASLRTQNTDISKQEARSFCFINID